MSYSYFTGSNPNVDIPTDRPQTLGVIYVASVDNSMWIWNGLIYILYPQQGTPDYHISSTTDAISDGVTTVPLAELTIWVPSGLTVLKCRYYLRISTQNASFGSSIIFPSTSGMTVTGLAYMSTDNTTSNALFSIDNTNAANTGVSFPVSGTTERTMIVDMVISNPSGSSADWYWTASLVPNPSNISYTRTVHTNSNVIYSYHYT